MQPGRRSLYALLAAHAVSLLGNVVAAIAIPWFVLVTTGSAAKTALAAFAATAPLVLGALFGAPVADRIGLRRASVASDVASASAVAAIPMLHAVGALELWMLLALAFLGALFDAPGQAARQALLPDLAGVASVPLERANSLYKAAEHGSYALGAPLAGALLAGLGAPAALWVDAGSFVVSALAVALLVPRLAAAPRGPYLRDVADGLRYVAREPVLRAFVLVPALGNFLISPLAPVVLPLYARRELGGAGALALMMTAYGVGGLLGTLAFGAAGERLPRRPVYVVLWLAAPLAALPLLPLPGLGVVLPVLALVGFLAGALGPLEHTVRQERTPRHLRARVFATAAAAEALAVPLGVLVAGAAVETFGLRGALALYVGGNAVLAAIAVTIRGARRLRRAGAPRRSTQFG